MLSLKVAAQNYDWGRPAIDSEVAKLAEANGSTIDDSKPFAELWIGSHTTLPAKVSGTDLTLSQWLKNHRADLPLGKRVSEHFGTEHLPFLLKVLSVEKALSIQSHPDKKLAERLHAERPHLYKDDNHKPEMAVALTEFEALCGFSSHEDFMKVLSAFPELRTAIGPSKCESLRSSAGSTESLKAAFQAVMSLEKAQVRDLVGEVVMRLTTDKMERQLTSREELALRLHDQFPFDIGILSSLFLNVVTLTPGQAIALESNEPHAYLSGEIVEVMASSDNVIRAGLTPKHRDTDVLCDTLTYKRGPPDIMSGTPQEGAGDSVLLYRPPFDEFELRRVGVPASGEVTLPASTGPSVLLVQSGMGTGKAVPESKTTAPPSTPLQRGGVFFIPAGTSVTLSASNGGIIAWLASVNERFLSAAGDETAALGATVEKPDLKRSGGQGSGSSKAAVAKSAAPAKAKGKKKAGAKADEPQPAQEAEELGVKAGEEEGPQPVVEGAAAKEAAVEEAEADVQKPSGKQGAGRAKAQGGKNKKGSKVGQKNADAAEEPERGPAAEQVAAAAVEEPPAAAVEPEAAPANVEGATNKDAGPADKDAAAAAEEEPVEEPEAPKPTGRRGGGRAKAAVAKPQPAKPKGVEKKKGSKKGQKDTDAVEEPDKAPVPEDATAVEEAPAATIEAEAAPAHVEEAKHEDAGPADKDEAAAVEDEPAEEPEAAKLAGRRGGGRAKAAGAKTAVAKPQPAQPTDKGKKQASPVKKPVPEKTSKAAAQAAEEPAVVAQEKSGTRNKRSRKGDKEEEEEKDSGDEDDKPTRATKKGSGKATAAKGAKEVGAKAKAATKQEAAGPAEGQATGRVTRGASKKPEPPAGTKDTAKGGAKGVAGKAKSSEQPAARTKRARK